MSWRNEYPELDVPDWVERHPSLGVDAGVCSEWANFEGDSVTLLVLHPDPAERSDTSWQRLWVIVERPEDDDQSEDIDMVHTDDDNVARRVLEWADDEVCRLGGFKAFRKVYALKRLLVLFDEHGHPNLPGLPDLSKPRHAWGIPAPAS